MILALDSSTSRASVALVSQGEVIREATVESPRGRGGGLFSALEEVLAGAGRLERVVVGIGPGSYNGIRGALAAGWGIAVSRKIPLVGVSSLLGLGLESYVALGDARRGQIYWAVVENSSFREDPVLLEATELPECLARFPQLPRYVPAPIKDIPLSQVEVRMPSAVLLASIGAKLPAASGIPEPIYLKPAYINLPGSPLAT